MRRTPFNNDWAFSENFTEDMLKGKGRMIPVRIPHTVKEMPLHYADHHAYQMVCGYCHKLKLNPAEKNRRFFLYFAGAAHIAEVYVNGILLMRHACGYTAFRVEITSALRFDQENIITVRLDTRESNNIPPFGNVIDYLTYGGIYRDVWLESSADAYIRDICCVVPDLKTLRIQLDADGRTQGRVWDLQLADAEGNVVRQYTCSAEQKLCLLKDLNVRPWSLEKPVLYTLHAALKEGSTVIDETETTVGFRTVSFDEKYFYLNGKRLFLRGLNRHQSYPYAGYAVPEKLQRYDADILKYELGCNAVRTSHYPQSQYFIDECDRIGLLVFTEIPGWQYIGDEAWKKQAIINTREMVTQYRNHPSVFLWGVRINESLDDDGFYRKTNLMARTLDPYRPTSGVRYLQKSSLLEDVYAFNDFSHRGDNAGVLPKKDVVKGKDSSRPLLISECNGHMFPTKASDTQLRREEHALRHAKVINDAIADQNHAGIFSWCMFDYATHKEFGSGDRICYHGVLDSFRNPKAAAYVYASQQDEKPVLYVSSSMNIGDYNGGSIDHVCVFTNADAVVLYRNDALVGTYYPNLDLSLKHPVIRIDDFIGSLLESEEGYGHRKAEEIKACLNAAKKYGWNTMPAKEKLRLVKTALQYHLSFAKGAELYGRYVGGWGDRDTVWKFVGIKNEKPVMTVFKTPGTHLHLEAIPSHTDLTEGDTYDMCELRIRVLDENNNLADYCALPIQAETDDLLKCTGPSIVTAEGGMCGFYFRTDGRNGETDVRLKAPGCEDTVIHFTVTGGR